MIQIRSARPEDADQMADLLNEIITVGGTTAHKRLFGPDRMRAHYIANHDSIVCHVAELEGHILGFQSLAWADPAHKGNHVLPEGWAIIATFTKIGQTQSGVGTQLFAKTVQASEAAGATAIDATIRKWNEGGLRYYSKMGFVTYREDAESVSKEYRFKAD